MTYFCGYELGMPSPTTLRKVGLEAAAHFTTSLYLQVLVRSSSSVASQRHKQVTLQVWVILPSPSLPMGVEFVRNLHFLQSP